MIVVVGYVQYGVNDGHPHAAAPVQRRVPGCSGIQVLHAANEVLAFQAEFFDQIPKLLTPVLGKYGVLSREVDRAKFRTACFEVVHPLIQAVLQIDQVADVLEYAPLAEGAKDQPLTWNVGGDMDQAGGSAFDTLQENRQFIQAFPEDQLTI